ncbi:hypothetical protein D3C77_598480 [compost metagenome]
MRVEFGCLAVFILDLVGLPVEEPGRRVQLDLVRRSAGAGTLTVFVRDAVALAGWLRQDAHVGNAVVHHGRAAGKAYEQCSGDESFHDCWRSRVAASLNSSIRTSIALFSPGRLRIT